MNGGSVASLWRVSYPIMLFFLSMVAMQFTDRVFLARYSSDALTAATGSGTLFLCPYFAWITLASRTEIFVAQYNGASNYSKLGQPVWQMLYLTVISVPFFILLSWFARHFLCEINFLNVYESEYFSWNCFFAPVSVVLSAVCGFYIGQKKTKIINLLGLLGNGVNVILDPILIFGCKGIIPSMGVKGAAIATGIGISCQAIVVVSMFLGKRNREQFGSFAYKFNAKLFSKMVKVGLPSSLAISSELLGWALFYWIMKQTSELHIFAASIGQSCLQLFIFFGAGLEKGSSALTGNLIGSKEYDEIKRLFQSGFILCIIFGAILALIRNHYVAELITKLFSQHPQQISNQLFIEMTYTIIGPIILYLVLENMRWHINGILNAAGDTLFVMFYGIISVWCFLLMPAYFIVWKGGGSVLVSFYIWVVFSFLALLLAIARFSNNKWKNKSLTSSSEI